MTPPSSPSGPAMSRSVEREVVDAVRERTDDGARVGPRAEPREVPGQRHAPEGRLQSVDAAPRGREADAAAGIAPERERRRHRPRRRPRHPTTNRPAARFGSRRVARRPVRGAVGERGGDADDDRARRTQARDGRRVALRPTVAVLGRRTGDGQPSTSIQSLTAIGTPSNAPAVPARDAFVARHAVRERSLGIERGDCADRRARTAETLDRIPRELDRRNVTRRAVRAGRRRRRSSYTSGRDAVRRRARPRTGGARRRAARAGPREPSACGR